MQNFNVSMMEEQVFPSSYISCDNEPVPDGADERDRYFMQYALHIAQCGRGGANPNPLVGAVIVRNGRIIAKGYHARAGEGHAEINAFMDAKKRGVDVKGAEMYVTLEPCSHYGKTPPCADRIVYEGISRVVAAMCDPNPRVAGQGIKRLKNAGIKIKTGVLEKEARELNQVFLKYITTKKPYVLLKMAMSMDGKIATKTGQSQWISSEESRRQVHYLRHSFPAVMVGIGTVLADDPMLNCRLDGAYRQPVRMIADTHLRIPLDSNIVKTAQTYQTMIAVGQDCVKTQAEKIKTLKQKGIEILSVPEKNNHLDLCCLMELLGKYRIDGILLEGGPDLAYAALNSGIVDKARFYIAPKIIGGCHAKGCIGGDGIEDLSHAILCSDIKAYPCGEDIFLEGSINDVYRNN